METDHIVPHISVKEATPLYLTKDGLPRKERLLSLDDVHEALEKNYSPDPIERYYQRNIGAAVMSALGRKMRAHNIVWITPKIGGVVYYGLSCDEEKRQNSIGRCDERRKAYTRIANQQRALIEGNRELLPLKEQVD